MDVRVRLLALALAALGAFTPSATAAPGDLDSTFSSDGKVTTLGSADTFVARAVAVQGDGKIVVGGYSCDDGTCGPTGNSSFRLMRYTPDGGLDTDFGNGGTVTTAVGTGRSQAFDVVLEADGGIVAGGVASASQSDPGSFALARYRSNGALDERFGTGGRVITPVRNGDRFDAIADLVPQEGGRLVAAGQAESQDGITRFALARYGSRGELDPSFGDFGGTSVVGGSGRYAFLAAGAVSSDGKIVGVGAAGPSDRVEDYRFSAIRANGQGRPERPAWTMPLGGSYSFANAAIATGENRVLVAGVATDGSGRPAMALALTRDGESLDPAWDGDGVALARAGDGAAAADLVGQPDGRAVAVGHVEASGGFEFAITRFEPNGALDRGFGREGFALTSFAPSSVARATAVARQADGRLVVAGLVCSGGQGTQCAGGTSRLALARYDSEPAPAPAEPAPGPAAPPARRAAAPFVSLPSTLRARRGRVRVRLRCLQSRRCRGTVSLTRPRSGKSSVLLGRRSVSVPARRTRVYSLRLRRSLGPSRRIRTRITFRGRDASGRVRSVSRRATLRH